MLAAAASWINTPCTAVVALQVCVYSKRLHGFEYVWSYVLGLFCISLMERRCQQVSHRTRERLTCRMAFALTSLLSHRHTNTALLASTTYWKWIWIRWCVQPCQGLGKDVCVNVKESRSRTMADLDSKLELCIDNSANFSTAWIQDGRRQRRSSKGFIVSPERQKMF